MDVFSDTHTGKSNGLNLSKIHPPYTECCRHLLYAYQKSKW